ncbi:MAG: rhodanese-like domain-containing protein [Gammaproteobacteria bacterium]|nr:rhodanese-like domain-containing protein [Gammaproteobacteria bacterium]
MKTINAHELKKKLESQEIILIDVREQIEHAQESIAGAQLIPLQTLSVAKLPATSKPIVFHCRAGKRSLDACQKILSENPNLDVYSLEGGIMAWRDAGFEVQKSCNTICTLPIERQLQLLEGGLTLFGTLSGLYLSKILFVIPIFVGLGQMYAGLSGHCYSACLLAQMPWNHKKP